MKWISRIFNANSIDERFQPSLIDLDAYEETLKQCKRDGQRPIPPRAIGNTSPPRYNDAELRAMEANRAKAKKLYKKYK